MNHFRSIPAVLMALLVIWPACCCYARAADSLMEPACCSAAAVPDGEEEPAQDLCDCLSQEPRDTVKNAGPQVQVTVPLALVSQTIAAPGLREEQRLPLAATPHTGCDPPRLLLARFSRWLI